MRGAMGFHTVMTRVTLCVTFPMMCARMTRVTPLGGESS
jgi:hypothetical protein